MNRYLQSALVAALGFASVTCALAQENPPPATTPQTEGSTRSPATATDPSTSTPSHQASTKSSHKQMMKDCVAKERAENSSMSASDAKKACKEQMKASGSQSKSY